MAMTLARMEETQVKETRLLINAELRADTPQGTTPEEQADNQNQQKATQKQPQNNTVEGYYTLDTIYRMLKKKE